VSFDSLLYLFLLDTDVSLRDCGAAMLQEMLDKSNVIAAVPVNLGGIELPERVCPYILDTEIFTDNLKLFLDSSLRKWKNYLCRGEMVF